MVLSVRIYLTGFLQGFYLRAHSEKVFNFMGNTMQSDSRLSESLKELLHNHQLTDSELEMVSCYMKMWNGKYFLYKIYNLIFLYKKKIISTRIKPPNDTNFFGNSSKDKMAMTEIEKEDKCWKIGNNFILEQGQAKASAMPSMSVILSTHSPLNHVIRD